MRQTWLVAISATAALAAITLANAQPTQKQVPWAQKEAPAIRTINLTLEQRHIIRELVADLKIEVKGSPVEVKVAAGDAVPKGIELHPIPPLIGQKVPQIKAHRFFVTQKQIVLVEPQENRVVEVIE